MKLYRWKAEIRNQKLKMRFQHRAMQRQMLEATLWAYMSNRRGFMALQGFWLT